MGGKPIPEGHRKINNNGYVEIKIDGKIQLEHRIVMEKFLKRKLKEGEIVHHKNEIKTDNRIENLSLLKNKSCHMFIHYSGNSLNDLFDNIITREEDRENKININLKNIHSILILDARLF